MVVAALAWWQVKRMGGIDAVITNLRHDAGQAQTTPGPSTPSAPPADNSAAPPETANSAPAAAPAERGTKSSAETVSGASGTKSTRAAPGGQKSAANEAAKAASTPPAQTASNANESKPAEVTGGKPSAATPASGSNAAGSASADTSTDNRAALGEQYLYGKGVPANCGRAVTLLRAAADSDDAKAQSLLGTMYATGHCVPQDLTSSYRYLDRALKQQPSNHLLAKNLLSVWDEMSPAERAAVGKSPR
jgi:TPR repeat protein